MRRPHMPSSSIEAVPEDVRRAFDYYDRNRTGYLDYLELHDALRGHGIDATVDESANLLASYDLMGDGRLNLYEFCTLLLDLGDENDVPSYVRSAFDYYDRNRTGLLDYVELQDALYGYGIDASPDESAECARLPKPPTETRLAPCSPCAPDVLCRHPSRAPAPSHARPHHRLLVITPAACLRVFCLSAACVHSSADAATAG